MKREIKFRSFYNDKSMLFSDSYVNLYHFFELKPEDYPLMQFTGLKDKNGVDIYECDILNINRGIFKGKINTVLFDNNEGRYLIDFEGLSKSKRISLSISKSTYIEVIGNIYENPKLLKP